MMSRNIEYLREGNIAAARAMLQLLPVAEKHFSAFDGHRLKLKSGANSAPFSKMLVAFRLEADQALADHLQASYNTSSTDYSVWVRVRVWRADPDREGGQHFELSCYVGKVDGWSVTGDQTGNFAYECDADSVRGMCQHIIDTEADDVREAIKLVEQKYQQINQLREAVPCCYRELFPRAH